MKTTTDTTARAAEVLADPRWAAAAAAGFRPRLRCTPDQASPAERHAALVAGLCRKIEAAGLRHSGGLLCYPDAAAVATLGEPRLRAAGLSATKTRALLALDRELRAAARLRTAGRLPARRRRGASRAAAAVGGFGADRRGRGEGLAGSLLAPACAGRGAFVGDAGGGRELRAGWELGGCTCSEDRQRAGRRRPESNSGQAKSASGRAAGHWPGIRLADPARVGGAAGNALRGVAWPCRAAFRDTANTAGVPLSRPLRRAGPARPDRPDVPRGRPPIRAVPGRR